MSKLSYPGNGTNTGRRKENETDVEPGCKALCQPWQGLGAAWWGGGSRPRPHAGTSQCSCTKNNHKWHLHFLIPGVVSPGEGPRMKGREPSCQALGHRQRGREGMSGTGGKQQLPPPRSPYVFRLSRPLRPGRRFFLRLPA